MPFQLFKKRVKKQYLALDIGSQNTKIMMFKPEKAAVDKMIIKRTPSNSFRGGVVNDETVLSDFLAQCLEEMHLENEINVIASISGKGIIAKKIDIPQMEESMIAEFVEIEAEQELFYNKEEMDLDYEILKGVNFNKPGAQSILVVTVIKNIVESYNSVMRKTGLECEILDTNFAALFNCFEHNESLDEESNYMVIDIGCVSTNLVIVVKNQVVFARTLPFGGDFFNQEIEKKMGISYEEAEELKVSASNGQDAPEELVSLIKNGANEMFAEELFSCYELYRSLFPGRDVNSAYVTGGASQTLGLISHLKDKLGFAVNHFNPFQNIELNSTLMEKQEEISRFSAVTTGLALRALL